MDDLVIVGAGGFGREVASLVERINEARSQPRWHLLGWLDDTPGKDGTVVGGYPVLGTVDTVAAYAGAHIVCAIGSAAARRSVVTRIERAGGATAYATLVDPAAHIFNRVDIGPGSIICAGSVLTADIQIGMHCIVNLCSTIGHDAVLEDFVTLYPGVNVSGNTRLGAGVEMGTGSQTIQGTAVGAGSIVGAGSTVVKDVPAGCTAVGSPARPIKFFEENP